MKPAAFAYHRAASLDEAIALLSRYGDAAKAIAGGQSLVPMMNLRLARPEHLIDLGPIPGLDAIDEDATHVSIGALARHEQVARSTMVRRACPVLATAAATIGHYAIRTRGTLGGSLAHADPAAQYPLVAVALGADVDVVGTNGRRRIAAGDFFEALMTTALAPDELVERARFPKTQPGERAAYAQFARRNGDFALAATVVRARTDAGRIIALGVTVGGATPVPAVLDDALRELVGAPADAASCAHAGAIASAAIDPDDHPRIPAEFRREIVAAVVSRALHEAMELPAARSLAPMRGER